jgi:hypothetical protein
VAEHFDFFAPVNFGGELANLGGCTPNIYRRFSDVSFVGYVMTGMEFPKKKDGHQQKYCYDDN